jgi:hypothetical protein
MRGSGVRFPSPAPSLSVPDLPAPKGLISFRPVRILDGRGGRQQVTDHVASLVRAAVRLLHGVGLSTARRRVSSANYSRLRERLVELGRVRAPSRNDTRVAVLVFYPPGLLRLVWCSSEIGHRRIPVGWRRGKYLIINQMSPSRCQLRSLEGTVYWLGLIVSGWEEKPWRCPKNRVSWLSFVAHSRSLARSGYHSGSTIDKPCVCRYAYCVDSFISNISIVANERLGASD